MIISFNYKVQYLLRNSIILNFHYILIKEIFVFLELLIINLLNQVHYILSIVLE